MSDARWSDVEEDLKAAAQHFDMAVRLFDDGGFEENSFEAYRARMALMHSLQSGHTSAEAALMKALVVLEEERPAGQDWHNTLLKRMARARHDEYARPAILDEELEDDLDETRRFRHRAMHGDERFKASRALPAIDAARRLRHSLQMIGRRLREMD